jgi:uncharacterized protein (DUF488 family)
MGYEAKDINEFIQMLQSNNIKTVVDVREIAGSRKKDFSKNKLIEHLSSANISYIHIRELGSPRILRKKLKKDKDYGYFFKKYNGYLKSQINIVKKLYKDIVTKELSCFICFERDPFLCHRKAIAEKIKEIDANGLSVNHI